MTRTASSNASGGRPAARRGVVAATAAATAGPPPARHRMTQHSEWSARCSSLPCSPHSWRVHSSTPWTRPSTRIPLMPRFDTRSPRPVAPHRGGLGQRGWIGSVSTAPTCWSALYSANSRSSGCTPAARRIAVLQSKLQRLNPLEQPDEHARLSGELFGLQKFHVGLREQAGGGL